MAKDVFISYKSQDYKTAKWVRDYLERCGVSVWMAPEDIEGGKSYAVSIPDAIEACKVFVLILSEKAQTSKWVPRELDQAINEDKRIMPFMIEKCELTRDFRFYLANIQSYGAYNDMQGTLMAMARDIMKVPGVGVKKAGEEKADERPQGQSVPENQPQSEPDFGGMVFSSERQKIKYAVSEGKRIYDDKEAAPEDRSKALQFIHWAASKNDPEGMYRFGLLLTGGSVRLKGADPADRGMMYLYRAARAGHPLAKGYMDRYCIARYNHFCRESMKLQEPAPLRDFDGWRIKINHSGMLVPVSAKLEFDGRENILYLGAHINFVEDDIEAVDHEKFHDAVVQGIQDWEGVYTVFGGQRLRVVIDVFEDDRILGAVNIMSMKSDITKRALKIAGLMDETRRSNVSEIAAATVNSLSTVGTKKWTVRSAKNIMLYNKTGRFDNYADIRRSVRYEFGRILGLGDICPTTTGSRAGIEKGTFPELDAYYIENKAYNLIRYNEYGMISNNDMEMVVLAFSENAMQYYQPDTEGNKPSKAMGKGN